ncbi:ATP-dependent helicase HrpB [Paenibacillus sp. CAU 1782]
MQPLPIDEVLPELLAALQNGNCAVLTADPGAGKTTRVPLAMLDEPWLDGGKIIMLEPRRLAARSAAAFMAKQLGESVGERVGYRVRLDSKVGPRTVIEVVTEGILTRMLQEDPGLTGVGAILFDEFHERHLHGDLGLALALQCQGLLREDLRLLVMSATLDAERVAELLDGAPVIASRGRSFPVETRHSLPSAKQKLEEKMAVAIMGALLERDGDVLAFLPGNAEIRRTAKQLTDRGLPAGTSVRELRGTLSLEEQAAAIAPAPEGGRKIVLATSIAESSLTVEGVRIVVDSGLMRVSRFSPRTGMSRLETVPVSKASADQRRGRAGRLAPGLCIRLWSEAEHSALPEFGNPEIAESDLAALRLELAVWGVNDPQELSWLTPPPAPAYGAATELLQALGSLTAAGGPTAAGKAIASLGLHPRLGAMLLRGKETGQLGLASRLAALLSERNLLPNERSVDIGLRLRRLESGDRDPSLKRLLAQAERWQTMLERSGGLVTEYDNAGTRLKDNMAAAAPSGRSSTGSGGAKDLTTGGLLAHAYPDRIAQRRSDGRYLLAAGRGAAALSADQQLSQAPYLVVCELDDAGVEGRILLADLLDREELQQELASFITEEESLEWEEEARAIRGRRRLKLGTLILKETPLKGGFDPEGAGDMWLKLIRERGFSFIPFSKSARGLLHRMWAMQAAGAREWPDVSENALMDSLEDWLKPHLGGIRAYAELEKMNVTNLLEGLLTWKQRSELDAETPLHWSVPSGSRIPIDYSNPAKPFAAVRLQELFGLAETPRLAGGRLPLTLHLLSPAGRPVQVTQDLASFWSNGYFEVKKDLKGRYPKHYWPDNPYEATPTNRAKPRTTPQQKG